MRGFRFSTRQICQRQRILSAIHQYFHCQVAPWPKFLIASQQPTRLEMESTNCAYFFLIKIKDLSIYLFANKYQNAPCNNKTNRFFAHLWINKYLHWLIKAKKRKFSTGNLDYNWKGRGWAVGVLVQLRLNAMDSDTEKKNLKKFITKSEIWMLLRNLHSRMLLGEDLILLIENNHRANWYQLHLFDFDN